MRDYEEVFVEKIKELVPDYLAIKRSGKKPALCGVNLYNIPANYKRKATAFLFDNMMHLSSRYSTSVSLLIHSSPFLLFISYGAIYNPVYSMSYLYDFFMNAIENA